MGKMKKKVNQATKIRQIFSSEMYRKLLKQHFFEQNFAPEFEPRPRISETH